MLNGICPDKGVSRLRNQEDPKWYCKNISFECFLFAVKTGWGFEKDREQVSRCILYAAVWRLLFFWKIFISGAEQNIKQHHCQEENCGKDFCLGCWFFSGPTWRVVAQLVYESFSIKPNVLLLLLIFLPVSQLYLFCLCRTHLTTLCPTFLLYSCIYFEVDGLKNLSIFLKNRMVTYMCPAHVGRFHGWITLFLLRFKQCCVCLVFFGFSVSETHEHFNAVSMRLNVLLQFSSILLKARVKIDFLSVVKNPFMLSVLEEFQPVHYIKWMRPLLAPSIGTTDRCPVCNCSADLESSVEHLFIAEVAWNTGRLLLKKKKKN